MGLGHFAPGKRLSEYAADDFLWNRPQITDRYFQHTVTVFGHTPTDYYGPAYAGRMLKTPTWMDIDTGAGHGGKPMLLRLEDERAFYLD